MADAKQLSGRIPALDGVRGVAVLLVMLCHFATVGLPDTFAGRLTYRLADAGGLEWICFSCCRDF